MVALPEARSLPLHGAVALVVERCECNVSAARDALLPAFRQGTITAIGLVPQSAADLLAERYANLTAELRGLRPPTTSSRYRFLDPMPHADAHLIGNADLAWAWTGDNGRPEDLPPADWYETVDWERDRVGRFRYVTVERSSLERWLDSFAPKDRTRRTLIWPGPIFRKEIWINRRCII